MIPLQSLRGMTYLDVDDATKTTMFGFDDDDNDNDNEIATTTTTASTTETGDQFDSSTALLVGFSVIGVSFFLVALMNIRINSKCQEFYEWNAIRLIMPAISLFLCMKNLTLAFGSSRSVASTQWAIALYMLDATVASGIFIFTFVLTFLSHRTRAMPFCFVYRGPGRQAASSSTGTTDAGESWQNDDDEEVYQPLVRPAVLVVAIRLVALGLLILNLIVNFDVVWSDDDLAGRTGWATVIREPSTASIDHVILSLLPMAIVCCCCIYFSCLLWRYGCEFSLIIYPSIINPWLWPIIGTVAMAVGQCFGPDLFPILSNTGILLYMISMLRVLSEVRYDIQQAGDLGHFLSAVGDDNITRTVTAFGKSEANTSSSASSPGEVTIAAMNSHSIEDHDTFETPSLPAGASFLGHASSDMRRDPTMSTSTVSRTNADFTITTRGPPAGREVESSSMSDRQSGSGRISSLTPKPITADAERKVIGSDAPITARTENPNILTVPKNVQGISARPENLRRGQRPKGRYVVY